MTRSNVYGLLLIPLLSIGCTERTSSSSTQGPATSAPTSTSASAGSDSETGTDDVTMDTTGSEPVTEAYCAQFEEQDGCENAVTPDAPLQCAYFDPQSGGGRLQQTDEGPRCGGWGTDYDGRRCVLVEHTPWACELEPPAEGIQACGGESPPWGYWQPGHEDDVRRSSLPCHLRPVGYETCWDNPIPACWCHCYPPPCETWPFCPPDDGGTGGSTGTDVDTTSDLGATDDTTGPATSTTTSN
jgi:hypothetical protein